MKNYINVITILLSLGVVMNTSCSKEEDVIVCDIGPGAPADSSIVILEFNATTNGEPLELLKEFKDPLNRTLHVEMLKYYVSNIFVQSGSKTHLAHDVGLIILEDPNYPDPNNEFHKIRLKLPLGNYDGIGFAIGLDPIQNESNPNDFPSEHPLSTDQNTHWGTWSNYKFFMMEGKGDWDDDGILSDIYGYHTGFDECYRELSFNYIFQSSNQVGANNHLKFTFEINEVFFGQDTLDMAIYPTWHGDTNTIERAFIISDNLASAIKPE